MRLRELSFLSLLVLSSCVDLPDRKAVYLTPIAFGVPHQDYDDQVDRANQVFNRVGITVYSEPVLEFWDVRYEVIEDWAPVHELYAWAEANWVQHHTVTVFLVEYLAPNGKALGGLQIPYGIILARNHRPLTLAHEIGHVLGLKHAWEDGIVESPDDCWYPDSCNLMGYCSNYVFTCVEHWLTEDQVKVLHASPILQAE